MLRHKLITLMMLFLSSIIAQQSHAVFPNDFSDVIWIDPNISSWAQTATVTANVSGSSLVITDSKRNVWPKAFNDTAGDCCNRSLWIFAKLQGQWYASTFEYMRVGQINKFAEAVNGQQIKRAPFLRSGYRWEPAEGEVYGFMTSGIARFNFDNNNVQERSNVALYRWGVGPTNNVDFTEVPRGADGRPVGDDPVVDDPVVGEPEVCVEPEAPAIVNASHTYTGPAQGLVVITGAQNATLPFSGDVSIIVKDDRSLTFTVSDETFSSTVAQDGTFEGVYNLSALGGSCQVIISVSGSVSGTSSSGTAQGSGNCIGSQANFNATYSATSPTEPSYLDQRPATPTPRPVCNNNVVLPAINLLLGEE
jgi:hypothetical protein